jgi:hypothetical protein
MGPADIVLLTLGPLSIMTIFANTIVGRSGVAFFNIA